MAQVKYGVRIAEIVCAIPYENPIRTKYVAQQFAAQTGLPYDKAKSAVNVKLKRLADQGELRRLQKGVYCHVKQTVFGPVSPDIDQMIAKSMTVSNGSRIGYESGAALLNRIGLSTLLPRKIQITTNLNSARLPEGCRIKLERPATVVTDENWRYLQFVDVIEFLPDAHVDAETFEPILAAFAKGQCLDPLTLIFVARKHYSSKTALRLTDLLMEASHDFAS